MAGGTWAPLQFVSEAPNALVATPESVVGDQTLPECHGIAISAQAQLDDFSVGFTVLAEPTTFEFSAPGRSTPRRSR